VRFLEPPASTGAAPWRPIVIRREAIDAEIARLSSLPAPPDGRRCSLIVHPRASAPGWGLAPGIRVSLEVLLPGERTAPARHNSTQLGFCIAGAGAVQFAGRRIDFARHDVWNHPAWATYWFENATDAPQVRLTYSNAALLEMLGVHVVDEHPEPAPAAPESNEAPSDPRRRSPFGTFPLGEDGARLMPYELLISPPAVESRALHWPWAEVRGHLDKLVALGKDYVGRRLYLLHNPVTGRTNGTTPSFFATMTIRPPKIVDRPHRHVSAAINYYFEGSGWSRVEGERIEWKAGDLMLSAPGWAAHNHASGDAPVYELTVQDLPFHIALESLLWQEDLKRPPALLGTQAGFATNREEGAER
ncbi:MAG: cupin domain-containing protein, partial [Myxococcales bacterium]|nr:cupin domain-containing protein [Myxococcales bacterium]